MESRTASRRRIVVGVDTSASSKRALRWAVDQASLTGAVVDAVLCWRFPDVPGLRTAAVERELRAAASRILAAAIAEAIPSDKSVVVRTTAVDGHATTELLERARGADLLVLGSRGHGGFAGALLGSVAQHCVQHAPCPVVVVRGEGGQANDRATRGHPGRPERVDLGPTK